MKSKTNQKHKYWCGTESKNLRKHNECMCMVLILKAQSFTANNVVQCFFSEETPAMN